LSGKKKRGGDYTYFNRRKSPSATTVTSALLLQPQNSRAMRDEELQRKEGRI